MKNPKHRWKGAALHAAAAERKAGAGGGRSDRHQVFFRAAEPLFERYGFRKTTVEEICRAAGASKRTFYEQFENKEDLFAQLTLWIAEEMVARWRHHISPSMTARAKIDLALEHYLVTGRQHPIFRQIFEEPALLSRLSSLLEDLSDSPLIAELRAVIEEGVASGELRPLDAEMTTWMIYALLDSVFFLLPAILRIERPLDDARLIQAVRGFILHGLGARDTPTGQTARQTAGTHAPRPAPEGGRTNARSGRRSLPTQKNTRSGRRSS